MQSHLVGQHVGLHRSGDDTQVMPPQSLPAMSWENYSDRQSTRCLWDSTASLPFLLFLLMSATSKTRWQQAPKVSTPFLRDQLPPAILKSNATT